MTRRVRDTIFLCLINKNFIFTHKVKIKFLIHLDLIHSFI